MNQHEAYMRRCFDLARLGAGYVSPNPMVGAVLVHNKRIIGEGFHRRYGGPHAEVEAVAAVRPKDRHLLPKATLYVSLEPCCIYGRTPPCTRMILAEKIPHVVISCLDQTAEVRGQGVAELSSAGVAVTTGVLEAEGLRLAAIRNIFTRENRPYVLLKYARTREGIFVPSNRKQTWITGLAAKKLVHRWRTHTDAILIGRTTAAQDNPQLTSRYFPGPQPLRIVLDAHAQLPQKLHLFQDKAPTLVVGPPRDLPDSVRFFQPDWQKPWIPQLLNELAQQSLTHLTVEGGIQVLQQFIDADLWDEARQWIGHRYLSEGLPAPVLPQAPQQVISLANDQLLIHYR